MRAAGPLDDDLAAFMRDPRLRDDPYPLYRRLQSEAPHKFRPSRAWLVTRYADVVQVLRHADAICDFGRGSDWRTTSPSGVPLLFRHLALVRRDPPDHTRVRGLIGGSFGPRLVPQLRPTIQALADRLLERTIARGEMDLYEDYAYPLPLAVIAGLFGIPDSDFPLFRRVARGLTARFGVNQVRSAADRRQGDEAEAELVRYFTELVDERSARPGDDLLSHLIETALDSDALSRDELIANIIFLAAAGHETTARLICNAVVAVLRDPALRAWLDYQPTFDRAAVEELCRWEPTVQVAPRMLREAASIGGVDLPAGQVIWNFLGAANRDEREFSEPDKLDLTRVHNPHLAFGTGIHSCVGAALGRAEIEIALNTLFARLPGVSLAVEHVRYKENLTLRGPERVPLQWRPLTSSD